MIRTTARDVQFPRAITVTRCALGGRLPARRSRCAYALVMAGVAAVALAVSACNSTTSYPQNRTLNFRLDSIDSLAVPYVQQVTDSTGVPTGDSVTISSGALVVRPDSVFLIMHATYEGARTTSVDINTASSTRSVTMATSWWTVERERPPSRSRT